MVFRCPVSKDESIAAPSVRVGHDGHKGCTKYTTPIFFILKVLLEALVRWPVVIRRALSDHLSLSSIIRNKLYVHTIREQVFYNGI